MKPFHLLLCVPLLAACATLGIGGGGGPRDNPEVRQRLWVQAFDAYSRDSVRVAKAMFQRLASEHPRTREGHDARYFMALLSLDPRAVADPRAAEENLRIYLADDSVQELRGGYRREATSLLGLARELRNPCGNRASGLGCDTTVVSRTVTVPGEAPAGPSAADLARLRRMYNERGDTIRDLRAELERIRNTLAPRRP
ncbi:MAG TPA: hypothetical protein VFS20_33665 [Longimicrobium sp.]|nr:hypothetical protein [Longimicrobium sp.]